MPESILERLNEGVVLGDGGYLLALENRGYVQAGPFTPEVTIENPNALLALHEEFVHAGAEVLQVLTFYASENKLAQTGYAGRLEEINRAAVRIAREAAAGKALVAGNICLTCSSSARRSSTWARPSSRSNVPEKLACPR